MDRASPALLTAFIAIFLGCSTAPKPAAQARIHPLVAGIALGLGDPKEVAKLPGAEAASADTWSFKSFQHLELAGKLWVTYQDGALVEAVFEPEDLESYLHVLIRSHEYQQFRSHPHEGDIWITGRKIHWGVTLPKSIGEFFPSTLTDELDERMSLDRVKKELRALGYSWKESPEKKLVEYSHSGLFKTGREFMYRSLSIAHFKDREQTGSAILEFLDGKLQCMTFHPKNGAPVSSGDRFLAERRKGDALYEPLNMEGD